LPPAGSFPAGGYIVTDRKSCSQNGQGKARLSAERARNNNIKTKGLKMNELKPEQRIAAFRRIVERCQCEMIEGRLIDLFSASIVVQVFDNLEPANQAKFTSMKAPVMATFALKLIDRIKNRGA